MRPRSRRLAPAGNGIYIGPMAARALKTAGALLLAAVLLVGCGDDRSAAEKAMNIKFQKVDYAMASVEVGAMPSQEVLGRLTRNYISIVREYADHLGPDEVRRRLVEKGDEIGPYCLPCKATLYDEAGK